MKRRRLIAVIWGIALLVLGIAGLLFNFGLLESYVLYSAYVVSGLLALGGLVFLIAIIINTERWVLTIPGFTLLSLGGVVFLTTLDNIPPEWMGAVFLGGISLGFLVLFLSNRRERWWALLQACIIAVVALVGAGMGSLSAEMLGAMLFGGLAVSFLLLYLLAGDRKRFSWALGVGGLLLLFAVALVAAVSGGDSILFKLWPGLLVLFGIFALGRAFTGRKAPQKAAPAVSARRAEDTAMGSVTDSDTARIVRPPEIVEAADESVEEVIPLPEPASEYTVEAEPMPEDIQTIDPDDPSASLDALLEASQQPPKEE